MIPIESTFFTSSYVNVPPIETSPVKLAPPAVKTPTKLAPPPGLTTSTSPEEIEPVSAFKVIEAVPIVRIPVILAFPSTTNALSG